MAEFLLNVLPEVANVLADKACDANWILELIEEQDFKAHIQPKSKRIEDIPYSKRLYKKRDLIERCFSKIKQYSCIATRYDQLPENYLTIAKLASSRLWLPLHGSAA